MIKIGSLYYWNDNYVLFGIVNRLNEVNNIFKYVDCTIEECDILFSSVFKSNKTYIGNPIIIYHTFEHPDNYTNILDYKYSISFFEDSLTNLYYPQWQCDFLNIGYRNKFLDIANKTKEKFCTFITSHNVKTRDLCQTRDITFKYISENYKKIDSCGPHLNNMENGLCCPRPMGEAVKFHLPYKFNLCFENTTSSGNLSYITEKISNAFWYNTVPIYMGSENVTKWFNPKAFINCNGLSQEEILKKVIDIDSDDSKYFSMLNEYPFIEHINYREYSTKRLYDFIIKICEENNIKI